MLTAVRVLLRETCGTFKISVLMLHYGTARPRDREAREQLASALPDAEVGEPDDVGAFEIRLDADDLEHALQGPGTVSRLPHR